MAQYPQGPQVPAPYPPAAANNSGQPGAQVPAELGGWNWGAFLMNWIWAIPHSAWVGLVLSLLLGIVGAIFLGVKGNELAWQNRRWESVQQFKDTQRVWAIWGLVILGVGVVVWILAMVLGVGGAMMAARNN